MLLLHSACLCPLHLSLSLSLWYTVLSSLNSDEERVSEVLEWWIICLKWNDCYEMEAFIWCCLNYTFMMFRVTTTITNSWRRWVLPVKKLVMGGKRNCVISGSLGCRHSCERSLSLSVCVCVQCVFQTGLCRPGGQQPWGTHAESVRFRLTCWWLLPDPSMFNVSTNPSKPSDPLLSWLHLQIAENTSVHAPPQNTDHLQGNQRPPLDHPLLNTPISI